MEMKKFGVAIVAAAIVGFSGVSNAEDSNVNAARELYNTAGMHQFHVWCTQGIASYDTKMQGSNAEDAQMKAYNEAKNAGKTTCWPIWRGKVGN